jgi:hypothetical protein
MSIKLKIDYKDYNKLKLFCERRIRGITNIDEWREQQLNLILKGSKHLKLDGKIIKKINSIIYKFNRNNSILGCLLDDTGKTKTSLYLVTHIIDEIEFFEDEIIGTVIFLETHIGKVLKEASDNLTRLVVIETPSQIIRIDIE